MRDIMPPGYSIPARRKRLESQLRKTRAGEMAKASPEERARIEKEIEAETDRQMRELRAKILGNGPVLWSH
ncbi:MAG: hypothetical protein ABSG59_00955 [Verrucomicrobiota bacterium]|jgi:hypothetical protein